MAPLMTCTGIRAAPAVPTLVHLPSTRPCKARLRLAHPPASIGYNHVELLDGLVQAINHAISRTDSGGGNEHPSPAQPRRRLSFGSSFTSELALASHDPEHPPSPHPPSSDAAVRAHTPSLDAYLALPVSEYALLDPDWVSWDESCGGWWLRVPLLGLLGLDLTPQMLIVATPDPARGSVKLDGSCMGLGVPAVDDALRVRVAATLSSGGARAEEGARGRAGLDAGRRGGGGATTAPAPAASWSIPGRPIRRLRRWVRGRGRGASQAAAATDTLRCAVRVSAELEVPAPLQAVPDRLLALAGRLAIQAVLQALLPNFLALMERDYASWRAAAEGGGAPRRTQDAVGALF
ncbi:hypothetical protein ACKKBF_B19800 [Auxenochlorella protothecoides x Auxenochlorella symbiontica]